jgi:hypothetical protein
MAELARRMEKLGRSICLLNRLRTRNRFGGLIGLAVNASAAIGAHNLGILVGHLVQEHGKRLAAAVA